ncbi:hypothetical protein LY284_29485 [Caballeronia sp. PC1]|nr:MULTISPECIES: hypothetical protein [Burkholderiaceae]MCE4546497.1 hypothetical protein [Caballeronia sp. PC1]MCE4573029.1 hypothetical protein [Caballeronia sp. CLC5]
MHTHDLLNKDIKAERQALIQTWAGSDDLFAVLERAAGHGPKR